VLSSSSAVRGPRHPRRLAAWLDLFFPSRPPLRRERGSAAEAVVTWGVVAAAALCPSSPEISPCQRSAVVLGFSGLQISRPSSSCTDSSTATEGSLIGMSADRGRSGSSSFGGWCLRRRRGDRPGGDRMAHRHRRPPRG
jgi:hypothetical protein